jgi:hypothetical protein
MSLREIWIQFQGTLELALRKIEVEIDLGQGERQGYVRLGEHLVNLDCRSG